MRQITEKTLLPLSLVIVLLSLAVWLSDLSSRANATSKVLDAHLEAVYKIDRRLARIEGRLKISEAEK
jgi:hypothetical protein